MILAVPRPEKYPATMIGRLLPSLLLALLFVSASSGCGDRSPGGSPAEGVGDTLERAEATPNASAGPAGRLHWFIPDGMRADPEVMDVFGWAQAGELPNIKILMDRGSWGYSIPTFPTHTPTNYATLLTGAWPEQHGVADGPMHVEGHPLAKPSVGGFSSVSRKLPAVWSLFEAVGKSVFLLSVPGSTPPELKAGSVTVRGRWGGWGADFHSLIFETVDPERVRSRARGARLFFLGSDLLTFVAPTPPGPDPSALGQGSFAPPVLVPMEGHGVTLTAVLRDGSDDGETSYDHVRIHDSGGVELATLAQGEWSDWLPLTLKWNGLEVNSNVRLNVIKLDADGFFRIRWVVDTLNRFITEPDTAAERLREGVGPMVDFVDNFPPQLIDFPEDKSTFLDEARMSLEWHRDVVDTVYEGWSPDVFIHSIYTPNQMLTSRWWLGYIDPQSKRYGDVNDEERAVLKQEVLQMYKELDEIVGKALATASEDTLIVLSSDHGAAPLDRWVRLNNLFAEKGWLAVQEDPATGAPTVDWANSKVVYLKMYSVYVHPGGLGGDWTRASGPEYEALRDEVTAALLALTDEDGTRPVMQVVRWEEVQDFLRLPADRVGDLILANRQGWGWNEELTADHEVFTTPLKTGYKQAILPMEAQAMWTPFVVAGPGVVPGHRVQQPIQHVDQLPTLLTLMGVPLPEHIQGQVLDEIIAKPQP